jgi:DNA-binding MarR family transcriptional regulator
MCVSAQIKALAAAVAAHESNLFAEYGLHASGYEVLTALEPVTETGLTLSKLAEALSVTPASMTNRVDQLVKRSLVERRVNPEDRRIGFVVLTDAGRSLLAELKPKIAKSEDTRFSGLKKGDRKDAQKLLARLMETLLDARPRKSVSGPE